MKKTRRDLKKAIAWLVLLGVFFAHLFLIKKWYGQNFICFFTDSPTFLNDLSLVYQAVLGSKGSLFDLSIFSRWAEAGTGQYWPPLPHMISLWTLVALPLDWFFLRNFIYLAAAMSGIYAATRVLTRSSLCGVLAAVIFSCYRIVDVEMLTCEVHLPVMACLAWGFWAYLQSQSFTKFWPSALVGVFMVLALYCDRLTPGFFFIPLFLIPANFRGKKSWVFMSLVLVFVISCAWPFYQPWLENTLGRGRMTLFSQSLTPMMPPSEYYRIVLHNPFFLFAHLAYYFISLVSLLGYGFAGLLLVGVAFFQQLKKPETKVVWFATIVPLAIFILIVKKEFVYISPLCIYFAMITGIGIFLVRKKIFQFVLIGMIIVSAVIQYRDLFMVNARKSPLFSPELKVLCARKIPLLMTAVPYVGASIGIRRKIFSIIDQLWPVLDVPFVPGAPQKIIMVDLRQNAEHHSAVFFLRVFSPEVKVLNPAFDPDFCRRFFSDLEQDFFYLLSDKEKYGGENALKDFGEASWQSIEPEYRFPDGQIILYRVER